MLKKDSFIKFMHMAA